MLPSCFDCQGCSRLENECRPVKSLLWLWCFEFPSSWINVADSLFQTILMILLSRLWLPVKKKENTDIFTLYCPLCLFWRCFYLDPLLCFKYFWLNNWSLVRQLLYVMLLQRYVAQICCFDAGLCTLGKWATLFWIIPTSEGRVEGEQRSGHGSEWQHLAERSGSSAVITLLSPVLSILEMGTLPGTKYWTNYASVCVCVCAYFILLQQKRGVIHCRTCVCFTGLYSISIWIKCKFTAPIKPTHHGGITKFSHILLWQEKNKFKHYGQMWLHIYRTRSML